MLDAKPVELLWTGGFDSTFRLLTLLLDHRLPVQPSYLYDARRASAPIEVATMDRIRAALSHAHPHTRELLLPTRVESVPAHAPDDDVQHAFDAILRDHRIGDQYAFLARWCHARGLRDVELSCEWGPRGTPHALEPFMTPAASPHGLPTFRLHRDAPDAFQRVFGMYTFPLMRMTKLEEAQIATRNDWNALLAETWFCHRPTRSQRPCGFCNPCQYALEEGFGARIPRSRRALSHLFNATLMPLRGRARQVLRRLRRYDVPRYR